MESKFLTSLEGKWLDDDVHFQLTEDLLYQSEILGGVLRIPKGYVTDFSSVPRIPVIYSFFGDKAHHESIPHDFLYQKHKVEIEIPLNTFEPIADKAFKTTTLIEVEVSKSMADSVFKEAMEARKKPAYIKWGMYLGVFFGGFSSYRSGPSRFKILDNK